MSEKNVTMKLVVNGERVSKSVRGGRRLLDFLREDLNLTGTKEGCGEGECGSCTVLLDGVSVLACLTPMEKAQGREITTVEGLSTGQELHPVQKAMVSAGAIQCGMCTPGMVVSSVDLLQRHPQPTREEIISGISGNLCRCTGYQKIIQAVEMAAQEMALRTGETG